MMNDSKGANGAAGSRSSLRLGAAGPGPGPPAPPAAAAAVTTLELGT